MSKATAVITDKFKMTFVRVPTAGLLERAQELMFKMGFKRWLGPKRVPRTEAASIKFICVDENNEMLYNRGEPCESLGYKEVTLFDLRQASDEVVRIKREESKASKKRRAQRKWDATATKNSFIGCPVRRDVVVAVKFRDGDVRTRPAGTFGWGDYQMDADIISYKVLTPNKHKPKGQVVSQDAMVEDIAASLGKSVAKVETDGWIAWDGGACPIPQGATFEARFRDGDETNELDDARSWRWDHTGGIGDFVAYRIVKPANEWIHHEEDEPPEAETAVLDTSVPNTNPKRQYGVQSVPLNMWSPLASAYGALGLYNGSLKYGKANFANTPVEASIYIAAAMRHLMAWACGQEDDPADGVPNLGGVLANVAILLESRAAGMLIDDRLKMAGYLSELEMLKGKVKFLSALHADKNPKHYTMEQK